MSQIKVMKSSVTSLSVDVVVNAANEDLLAGGGVCGAIFRAAGYEELQQACDEIGHCDTGSAVITPGFNLKARYIIHAVGPIWMGGGHGEASLLYGAYISALNLAKEKGCKRIGFPLISSGIYGYPVDQAWARAMEACRDFLDEGNDMEIIFAVLSDIMLEKGERALGEVAGKYR